ncbi:MAG: class I SAM-dependent methyltransferase [Chloroflexota bacterium]|nr:class I SAM-dependent methyltransferase [Chloroflexota bacterium]
MPPVSFDRAAEYYDTTRGYAEGSAERIRDAIVAYTAAGSNTRFLELGVGTGRIALPFIRAGYDYTGVDISPAMMERLTGKLSGDSGKAAYRFQLREADITALPFEVAHFDVIIAVHVLHLVAEWQHTIQEARRVLRPGGWLLCGSDETVGEDNASADASLPSPLRVRLKWWELRRELGLGRRVGRSNLRSRDAQLIEYVRGLGATVDTVVLAKYELPAISARAMADRIKARVFSADWDTAEVAHADLARRLDDWLVQSIESPDAPLPITGEFIAITATWPEHRD